MGYEDSLRVLRRDKRFEPLIKKHGPPDLKRGNNPFQSLVRSIVYQQVTGKAAAAILQRFESLFGGTKFPTPEAVRAMSFEKLRLAGLSAQKATYVKDLAEKFCNKTVKHTLLRRMSNEEIIEHLRQVRGIGVWTAHMFLIFALNRLDVLPTGDLGIRKGFQIVYGLKNLPDHATMERLAKPWREYASVASWYLWRAVLGSREKSKLK